MRDVVVAAILLGCVALAVYRPFAGIMLWSWISFMNLHRLTWGFAATQPWALLAFAGTVAGCVMNREPKRLAINAVTVLLVVFFLCITITSLTAIGTQAVVWDQWERNLKIIVALLLTASMLDSRLRLHAMVWLMVVAVGYFGVRGGMFTLITGGSFIVLGPPDTMIADRNHLAVALLVVLPLMNYLRMHSRHQIVRYGLAAAMVLTLFSAIGTQSRGALVAMVATAGLFWLRSRGKLITGIATVVAVAGVLTFMPASWTERMSTIRTYEADASAMGRVEIWRAAFALAVSRPILGGGFRAIYNQDVVNAVAPGVVARATHSIWFEVIGDHGFLVFGVWAGIIVAAAIYTIRITRLADGRPELRWAADFARMSQASLVAYCVGGSFLSLSYWDFFWTLCVVIAATHALVAKTVEEQAGRRAEAGNPVAGAVPAFGWRAREARQ